MSAGNGKMTIEDVNKCFGEWQAVQPTGIMVYSAEEMLVAYQAGFNAALEYVNSEMEHAAEAQA